MRDSVTVDGVTLTRAQVEKALAELDAPTLQPKAGDVLVGHGNRAWLFTDQKHWVGVSGFDSGVCPRPDSDVERLTSFAELVRFYRKAKGL